MDCQVTSMAASSIKDDIPEGRVDKVCREWLVREDSFFAHKLQDEEIVHHYEGNRNKNRIIRHDIKQAKVLQKDEELAERLEYEKRLQEIRENDEKFAKEIQERLIHEEEKMLQEKSLIEESDQKMALRLQEKEKERLRKRRLQKEKLQVEKIRLESVGSLNPNLLNAINRTIIQLENYDPANPHDDLNDLDLTEFCLKPPPHLSEEEKKLFIIKQDEELARFLEQYEAKKISSDIRKKQNLIAAQDHEIARRLQENERARAKRLKEKARLRALQKKAENETEVKIGCQELDSNQEHKDLTKRALPPIPSYHNVVLDIDPTYKRNSKQNQSPPSNSLNNEKIRDCDGLHFAQLCPVTPVSYDSQSQPSTLQRSEHSSECGSAILESISYQPVQGQRRTSNGTKNRNKKKTREACRTQ